MIENADNRMDACFVRDRATALKKHTDPRLKGSMILAEDLSLVFMGKKKVKLNQLWPVGFSILEYSKCHMLSLFYKHIRPAFMNKATILLSDTDSFVLALSSPSTDHAISVLGDVMDTSNYKPSHPLYNASRKNVPGLLKNESPDQDIVEVCAVRSKTYAFRTKTSMDSRCKGVKKNVRKKIPFQEYRDTVLASAKNPKSVTVTQFQLQARNHINRLIKVEKIAMTSFDDKRSLAVCGIHSFPYGSKLIEMSADSCFYCDNPKLFS